MGRHNSIANEIIAGITAALTERAQSVNNSPTITAIAKRYGVSRDFVRAVASGARCPDDDHPGEGRENGAHADNARQ